MDEVTGAVIAIASRAASPWAVPLAAFLGALAAVALVYRLSLVSGRRLDPHVLLLSGVVVGAFAGALMSAIMVLSDAPGVRNAFLWLLGGFGAASWRALAVFSAYAAIPLLILFYHARSLDLIALGDDPAHRAVVVADQVDQQFVQLLKPDQWERLIDRLGEIDNPDVPVGPSKFSLPSEQAQEKGKGKVLRRAPTPRV